MALSETYSVESGSTRYLVSLKLFTSSTQFNPTTMDPFLTKRPFGRIFFPRGEPLEPPFVAHFGFLPCRTLSSNGRLSLRPCTRGAYKGIHALESVAMCLSCQPKQMRRN
ncbi:MAG: hypothetical protein R3309_15965, partial [Reinekea sp.]|nr:hypothetical protein [Reinekea sp.]